MNLFKKSKILKFVVRKFNIKKIIFILTYISENKFL